MKRKGWFSTGVTLLACLGMLVSGPALQAATTEGGPTLLAVGQASAVPDVALDAGGALRGQVVDAHGNPLSRTPVAIRHFDREVARTISDASGNFRVTGLRGGVYGIVVGRTATVCRLWVPNTAPPSARPAALIVVGGEQLLAQGGCGFGGCDPCCPPARTSDRLKCWLANPLVIAGIIVTAVAIPVAIHNCRDHEPHSPSG
jgi:hypothetical protein